VIPTGLGRISLIVAVLGLIGYLITGDSPFGFAFVAGLGVTGLHWAYSGGWGENSYQHRRGSLPPPEATLGGQNDSTGWVWYIVGVAFFLGLIAVGLAASAS
jgi:hypothetical protein